MRVLFVLQSIGYGGSMTSLINLLTLLNDNKQIEYEVLFMDPYGELKSEVAKIARICSSDKQLEAVSLNRKKITAMKKYGLFIRRCMYSLKGKLQKLPTNTVGYQEAAKKYDNKYDCVIAYQESVATDFVCHIKAKKRIAWVHNDYENVLKIYGCRERLQKIYASYDKVVCVSKSGAESFKKFSGVEKYKITCIYNTLLVDTLNAKAKINVDNVLTENKKGKIKNALECDQIKFVSSGRFVRQKRFDRVIDTAAILRAQGYKFKWFILGNGALYDEILQGIECLQLEEYVYLTGGLDNPFPVVKKCDIFVLTSEFEAHPMVANEALILGKPVVTTNFESAKEVVADRQTGIICQMEPERIAAAIKEILDDKILYEKLKSEAEAFEYSNQMIIDEVMKVITQ